MFIINEKPNKSYEKSVINKKKNMYTTQKHIYVKKILPLINSVKFLKNL